MPLTPSLDEEISFRLENIFMHACLYCEYVHFISTLPCSDNSFIMLRGFGHLQYPSDTRYKAFCVSNAFTTNAKRV